MEVFLVDCCGMTAAEEKTLFFHSHRPTELRTKCYFVQWLQVLQKKRVFQALGKEAKEQVGLSWVQEDMEWPMGWISAQLVSGP